eukprot:Filipodium_phascolosomae@DN4592_c0_g1_i1.p1
MTQYEEELKTLAKQQEMLGRSNRTLLKRRRSPSRSTRKRRSRREENDDKRHGSSGRRSRTTRNVRNGREDFNIADASNDNSENGYLSENSQGGATPWHSDSNSADTGSGAVHIPRDPVNPLNAAYDRDYYYQKLEDVARARKRSHQRRGRHDKHHR